jgi:hypothetical protein
MFVEFWIIQESKKNNFIILKMYVISKETIKINKEKKKRFDMMSTKFNKTYLL